MKSYILPVAEARNQTIARLLGQGFKREHTEVM